MCVCINLIKNNMWNIKTRHIVYFQICILTQCDYHTHLLSTTAQYTYVRKHPEISKLDLLVIVYPVIPVVYPSNDGHL